MPSRYRALSAATCALASITSAQALAQTSAPSSQAKPAELPPVEVTTEAPQGAKPKAVRSKKPAQVQAQPTPPIAPNEATAEPQSTSSDSSYSAGGALGPTDGYSASSAISATRTDTPILETPQAVSVVTRDQITDRDAPDTNAALVTTPGFARSGDYLFSQSYSLRGFLVGSNEIYQRFKDGRRAPSDLVIDPDLLERIEVIKGPASVLYGQIEPGGLVNYVSKRAYLGDTFGSIEQSFSSFDQFKTAFDYNMASGGVAARLPGVYAQGNSFRDEVDYDSWGVAPAFTWKVNEDTRVSLLTSLSHKRKTDDSIGIPFPGNGPSLAPIPRERFLGDPSFDQEQDAGSVSVELEHRLTPGATLRSSYGYFKLERDIEYALNAFIFPLAGTSLSRFGGLTTEATSGHQTQHDLLLKGTVLGMKQEFLVGFDALWGEHIQTIDIGFMNPIYINNPSYDPTVTPPFLFDGYVGAFDSADYGVYLQNNTTLVEGLPGIHKLSLLLGGRWDWHKETLETEGSIFFSPAAGAVVENDAFSPRAAVLWMPVDGVSVYGSYSESFNPNRADQITGNAPPTLGQQYEAGVKVQLLPKLAGTVAVFDITKENVPTSDGFVTRFAGEVSSRGIEFELVGEILTGWQISSGLAFIDTKIVEDLDPSIVGNRLLAAPETTLGLWTSYTFQPGSPLAGIGFGAGVTHVSQLFNDNANLQSIPGYTYFDAALWYRPEMNGPVKLEYQLNVQNLTDEEYFIAGDGFNAVEPGTARTIVGSVKMKF